MSIQNIVSLVGGLNNITAIKSPDKMYYCKFQNGEKYLWGFLSPSDPRLETVLIKKEVSIEQHQQLLSGGNIIYYEGKVFNADSDQYYLNDNGDFIKRDDEEYNQIKAGLKKEELIQYLYTIKADKAYGGVIINNAIKFETNQTSITNTVATIALMGDTDKTNWKFYTLNDGPIMIEITKLQLAGIAQFGKDMINACFAVEGNYIEQVKSATVAELISEGWVSQFKASAQAAMDQVNNKIEIDFTQNS
ncbi:MAG: hypothetical protein SPL76_01860 [Cyanobacteriota bacterium]|nr:hypothetical protein [Cyanobacteriota bacterium]